MRTEMRSEVSTFKLDYYRRIAAVQREIDYLVSVAVMLMSRDQPKYLLRDGDLILLPIERDDLTQSNLDYIKTCIAKHYIEMHRLQRHCAEGLGNLGSAGETTD